jgi:hypothetical protein
VIKHLALPATIAVSMGSLYFVNDLLRVYYEDCIDGACVVLPLSAHDAETYITPAQIDDVVATVIGEVRGVDNPAEVAAVTDVIYNRFESGSWGDTLSDVVHYHVKGLHAFSCWNERDPSYKIASRPGVARDPKYKSIRWIVELHINYRFAGKPIKLTHGATHYYHPASMMPAGRVPSWATKYPLVAKIGGAKFYRAPWAHPLS